MYQYQHYPRPDYNIYQKAVSVSEPIVIATKGNPNPDPYQQTLLRRVEVPFTREVQVPTVVSKVVPTVVETRVPVKKLVEVPGYSFVQEPYTAYEEREAVRNKEIWVKKIVPEKYIEHVPVQRFRTVQKPTTVIREVETYETVQVPSSKLEAVQGYRVDTIEDRKVVEVEEDQDYGFKSYPMGNPKIQDTRGLDYRPTSSQGRNIGANAFEPGAAELRNLPLDNDRNISAPSLPAPSSAYYAPSPSSQHLSSSRRLAPLASSQSLRSSSPSPYVSSFFRSSADPRRSLDPYAQSPAGSFHKYQSGSATADQNQIAETQKRIGVSLSESLSKHTQGSGVALRSVDKNGLASRAGLQDGDLVTAVAGRPVQTVSEAVQVLSRVSGPVQVNFNRDGKQRLATTLYR